MDAVNTGRRIAIGVAMILGVVTAGPLWAADQSSPTAAFDTKQTQEVGEMVRQYILKHPEVLIESLEKFQAQQQRAEEERLSQAASGVRPVSSQDHILGRPNAPVKVIEFSDFECPYCKGFQSTMKSLMDEYGTGGKVAWVYRHFPIDELHSKARKEAQAAECANELGGSKGFWAYADRLFEVTPSNNRLDPALLPRIAEEVGLDRARFETCLQGDARGGKYADHIEADVRDATASGGTGTPYSVVIGPKGQAHPVNGALPYTDLKAIIETALKGQ